MSRGTCVQNFERLLSMVWAGRVPDTKKRKKTHIYLSKNKNTPRLAVIKKHEDTYI